MKPKLDKIKGVTVSHTSAMWQSQDRNHVQLSPEPMNAGFSSVSTYQSTSEQKSLRITTRGNAASEGWRLGHVGIEDIYALSKSTWGFEVKRADKSRASRSTGNKGTVTSGCN